ncbi:DUF2147 domain-containing protein [Psychroflexus sp. ALD_RP9]|uniref:DUF2147 domain-containing protein n=1 Tax=Psychroflexus sp. ALD_RP9 TaxID=2777186 RepID=UPI001A8FCF7B|nr:DUF2147 domain-containing protein [Psychroflexus sp. ALD_RP9]QSS96968.1 DUF2147 domain-containing protein [Psychroflexus sp. ALD_RP9]
MKKYLKTIFFLLILNTLTTYSQSVFGKWYTVDDQSGIKKSIVEIYKDNNQVEGKITKILKKSKQNMRCKKCKGNMKNKKIEGLVILRNLEKDGDEYTNGRITDPENGKTYDAKIWINPDHPNELKVRGYVAFFYRTQTWKRVTKK